MEKENKQFRDQMAQPDQPKTLRWGRDQLVTSEEQLDIAEDEVYNEYFEAKTELQAENQKNQSTRTGGRPGGCLPLRVPAVLRL